jgi:sterol desaturase/sphingolipid hydroxylase (fatty acid hydroxylase superfamily)
MIATMTDLGFAPPRAPVPPPALPSRRKYWLLRLAALAAVIVTLLVDRTPLLSLAVIFIAVVPFERLFPRRSQPLRRPHLGSDVAYALLSAPLNAAGIVVGVAISALSLVWLPGLILRPLVTMIPPLPRMLVGLVLFDLVSYWTHRFSHEVPFMWRFHRVHHSTVHLDWVSGFRIHPFDGILLAPAFVLLVAAGFSETFSGVLLVIQIVTGLFLHANVRWRWKPLHKVVITPEFHHWHHANEPDAHNSNYSAFLPVWDLLFGTYFVPKDRRPQRYGVDDPMPAGMVAQLWWPLRGLRNPLPMLRHPVTGVRETARMIRRGVGQLRSAARRRRVPQQ